MCNTGTVRWFDVREGYGVITPDDGSWEVLVHAAVVASGVTLRQGLKVEFDAVAGPRGMLATRVLAARP